MASPVEQLQADAVNPSVSVATLLRRVKLIAAKLQLSETAEWAESELSGYKDSLDDDRLPSYRKVMGQVKAYSPYHGWQPPGGDSEIIDMMCKRSMGDSISALEDLLAKHDGGTLVMLISNSIKQKVLEPNYGWTDMHTEIPRSAVVGIIEHVRNMALNWAIELERKGISGEGVTFSTQEREKAESAHINIQNFQGNLNTGDVSGAGNRINIGSTDMSVNVTAEKVFGDVENAVRQGVGDAEAQQQLLDAIGQMREQLGKAGFFPAYLKFVGVAADHLSIIAPFLPALSSLVSGVS